MKQVRSTGVLLVLFLLLSFPVQAAPSNEETVRNLIVVLDASRSMQGTGSIIGSDPEGYRFIAIRQFVYYLAQETDCRLGWIVFSSHVDAAEEPVFIRDQNHAGEIYGKIEGTSNNADGRLTNIGEALERAVKMASSGGRSTDEYRILLVSDGNTDMDDNPNIESKADIESKNQRDRAVKDAADKGIPIYCICLNANRDKAAGGAVNGKQYAYIGDMAEMSNIANRTHGKAIELTDELDLQDEFLFNNFLEAALGLKMSDAMTGVIGEDETLDYTFTVPGLGLERVDIKVGGNVKSLSLLTPLEKDVKDYVTNIDTGFSFLKARGEVIDTPGKWILRVTGDRGNRVKFQMLNRLDIEAVLDAGRNTVWGDPFAVSVRLRAASIEADTPTQYEGYRTSIQIEDEHGNPLRNIPGLHAGEEIPLSADGSCFRTELTFPEGFEGNYRIRALTTAVVKIHGVNEQGEEEETEQTQDFQSNAITVHVTAPPPPIPIPLENPALKTCIRYLRFSLDYPSLFTNPEIVTRYEVLREGIFATEGSGINVDRNDNSLTVPSFFLKEGIIIIRAYNEEGDYYDVSVNVESIDPVPFLIGIFMAVVIALLVFLIRKSKTPFYGTIKITIYEDGRAAAPASEQKPTIGKCRLGRFGAGNRYNGLHPGKSWFQPTGKDYIIFHASHPVRAGNGSQRGKKIVDIRDRIPVNIYVGDETKSWIKVEFTSAIPRRKQHRRKAPRPPRKSMSGHIGAVSGGRKNSPWEK